MTTGETYLLFKAYLQLERTVFEATRIVFTQALPLWSRGLTSFNRMGKFPRRTVSGQEAKQLYLPLIPHSLLCQDGSQTNSISGKYL